MQQKKYYTIILYFGFCILTVLSFAFGYLHTTSEIQKNDITSEIGSYETAKDINAKVNEVQNASNYSIISENTLLTTKIYYEACNHTISETTLLPHDLADLTELQFKIAYKEWSIDKFTAEEIIISKKVSQKCPNHYILKVKDGKIAIYYETPINGVNLKEITNISVTNLPTKDQTELERGIMVDSNDLLAQLLEDFGS